MSNNESLSSDAVVDDFSHVTATTTTTTTAPTSTAIDHDIGSAPTTLPDAPPHDDTPPLDQHNSPDHAATALFLGQKERRKSSSVKTFQGDNLGLGMNQNILKMLAKHGINEQHNYWFGFEGMLMCAFIVNDMINCVFIHIA